jgi:O-antigen ligase
MRATGIFDNPNLTSSLIGVLLVCIILERSRSNIKVIVLELSIGVIALIFTNGFGSIIALLGSIFYYSLITSVKSKIPKFVFGVTAFSIFGGFMIFLNLFRTRFQKSFKSRIEIWNNVIENLWESPFVPEKNYYFVVKDFFIYEAHNDILDFGLKYGFFGAIIFIIFLFALWTNQDLNTKTVLLYVILSGLTHSVFNYRWNWIFIAYFMLNNRERTDFKSVKY